MAAARDFYRSGNDFTVLFDHKTDFAQSDSSFGGAQMRNVSVLLSHEYDNKPADPEFESEKASVWESRKAKTPGLFNSSKFRFNGLECKKNHLSLYLGLTDYKDYVCTNMNEDKWQYLAKISGELYGDQQTCFAHPLGVGAVVVSRDNQVLFIRRSHMVYEAPGMVDVPGGHPEPSVCANLPTPHPRTQFNSHPNPTEPTHLTSADQQLTNTKLSHHAKLGHYG